MSMRIDYNNVREQGEDVSIPEANHPKQRTEHMRGKKRVQAG